VRGEAIVVAALVFAKVVRVLHEGPRHPTQSDFETLALGDAEDFEEGFQDQELARLVVEGGLRAISPEDDFGAFEVPSDLEDGAAQSDPLC